MIAGLEKISNGDIFIDDRRINDLAPKEREVAVVFQNQALYPQMSVAQNLAFGLKRRKFGQAETKKRVAEAARIFALEQFLESKPSTLSPEQRARVALARAATRQPKIFLFDEPLSGIDAGSRARLRAEIIKLSRRLFATMLYVTSDPSEAMALGGDRIVVMNDGAIEQADEPFTIYNKPISVLVAKFFGSPPMNLLRGTLKRDRDSILFRESENGTVELHLPLTQFPAAANLNSEPVLLGIRPEDIQIAPPSIGSEKSSPSFPAIVENIELAGAEALIYFQTGAHTAVCRTRSGRGLPESGHRSRFLINAETLHFFDPISSRRLT
jgi:multiple sugar transport system ATP-binding protein